MVEHSTVGNWPLPAEHIANYPASMRYLIEQFAVGALRRGQGIEQFLGAVNTPRSPDVPGIRWVGIEPTKRGYVVTLYEAEDVGEGRFADLLSFPPLNPDGEDDGVELTVTGDELTAMTVAEAQAGAP